jgi:hypothetical protein
MGMRARRLYCWARFEDISFETESAGARGHWYS